MSVDTRSVRDTGIVVSTPAPIRVPTASNRPNATAPKDSDGTQRKPRLTHIPGLDGVRAIAIIAVLIFHGSASWLPGGFLGVDVFFVLSGFLITSILLREVETTGKLNFGQFYLNRARRLLPALLVVLTASAFLVLIFAHDAAAKLREDIIASLLYVTNWWNIAGSQSYFDATGRPPLLQHLWSLGLEEQFYFIWPLVMLIAYRYRGRFGVRRTAMVGVILSTLLMFTLSIIWDMPGGADPSRLYFGSDTHAMAILVGAALATVWRPGHLPKKMPSQPGLVLTGIGLGAFALMCWAFFNIYSDSTLLYRGGFLVFSALTAVFIAVMSHPAIAAGRILGSQPMKYIGQRSYGLYLWHWPIFMLTRPGIDVDWTGLNAFIFQMTLTVMCAEVSYRYLEMPIRNGAIGRTWKQWRAGDPKLLMKRMSILVGVTTVTVLGLALGLAAIPPVTATDYLGGITATGTEALTPLPTPNPELSGAPTESHATAAPTPPQPGEDLTKRPITAIGDSVMLGARDALKAAMPKITVDAEVSRQLNAVGGRITARLAAGQMAPIVLIHSGTNGPAVFADLDKMVTKLDDRTRVVLINTHSPEPWQDSSNDVIAKVAAKHPNVRVADWAAAANGHREYFVPDGTHTTPAGAKVFAQTVVTALNSQ